MNKPLSDITQSFLRELRALAVKYSDTHAIAYVVVPEDKNEQACYEGNACIVCVRDGYDGLVTEKGIQHGHSNTPPVPLDRIH